MKLRNNIRRGCLWVRRYWVRLSITFISIVAYFAVFLKVPLLVLMVIATLATGFMMWLIIFRLRQLLVSPAYVFIFGGKTCAFILCVASVYLILWPLPKRIQLVTNIWFALFALCFILSDIGHFIYSRDLAAVLRSDNYKEELPAVPPTAQQQPPHKLP